VAVLQALLRLRQQRLGFRNPRRQRLDQCRLLGQQRILLGSTKRNRNGGGMRKSRSQLLEIEERLLAGSKGESMK
jgi:hypothetical protein